MWPFFTHVYPRAQDNGSQNYPSIAAYARTPDRDATFHGRMFKLYSAIHSCVVNDEKNLPSVLANLESKYKLIADPSAKVPTVAFGKTGIDMPTLTLGTMRFQETWNGAKHTDPAKIDADVDSACQANLKATLLYALERGINHIETARGYGASEIQLGKAIKEILAEGVYKREDLIIQTKVGAKDTREEFISSLETSFEYMGVDYFDLFSFHGLNKYKDFDKVFNETDGLYAALEPYLADGRIKHVGFSTHGPTDLISKLIASEKFAYVNLHYHWCGSYTAGGHTPTVADAGPGNESCVKMARDLNMGVFCISPLDKGGGVHNASYKFRKMTENEGLDPVEFSVGWTCGVHDTQTIGCARPEDLDVSARRTHVEPNEPVISQQSANHQPTISQQLRPLVHKCARTRAHTVPSIFRRCTTRPSASPTPPSRPGSRRSRRPWTKRSSPSAERSGAKRGSGGCRPALRARPAPTSRTMSGSTTSCTRSDSSGTSSSAPAPE